MNRSKYKWNGYVEPNQKHPDSKLFQEHSGHARKNTRRWCKGHEGREHVPVVVLGHSWGNSCREVGWFDRSARTWQNSGRWSCYHLLACDVCGKHLNENIPCPDRPVDGPKQMWLDL